MIRHRPFSGKNQSYFHRSNIPPAQLKISLEKTNLNSPFVPRALTGSSICTLHFTGNPFSKITWIREDAGDVLSRNEELTFSAFHRSQAANRQCLLQRGEETHSWEHKAPLNNEEADSDAIFKEDKPILWRVLLCSVISESIGGVSRDILIDSGSESNLISMGTLQELKYQGLRLHYNHA